MRWTPTLRHWPSWPGYGEWGQLNARLVREVAPGRGVLVDYGCGGGAVSSLLAAEFDTTVLVDVDESSRMIARSRCGPGAHAAAPDDPWLETLRADVVVCTAVLQHCEPPDAMDMLCVISDLLMPGGGALIQTRRHARNAPPGAMEARCLWSDEYARYVMSVSDLTARVVHRDDWCGYTWWACGRAG